MPGNTKALKNRIKSVNSTLHLTKAMGLVASSKIKKANAAMFGARDYEKALRSIVSVLSESRECKKSPYLNDNGKKPFVIAIAGDRGLAGGYNANIFRTIREMGDVDIYPIGKRACERFGGEITLSEKYTSEQAAALATDICKKYTAGEIGKVYIVSTEYVSIMSQVPQVKQILPIALEGTQANTVTTFEPDPETVLESAVLEYVSGNLMYAIKESFASEVAARRVAMDAAGKNAGAMIDNLTLEYNRARQSAITQEITEIVAGASN